MYTELMQYIGSVKNEYLSALLKSFFTDDADFIAKFKSIAAGKTVHHGFLGGLLEHSLSVTRLCVKIAENYPFLNRDLLITCAALHDAGKVKELAPFPKNDYTDEGNFLGHIVMGYEMIQQKIAGIEGFPAGAGFRSRTLYFIPSRELEYGLRKNLVLWKR